MFIVSIQIVLIFFFIILPQIKIKFANKNAEKIIVGDFIGQNFLEENIIVKNENSELNNNSEQNSKKINKQLVRARRL